LEKRLRGEGSVAPEAGDGVMVRVGVSGDEAHGYVAGGGTLDPARATKSKGYQNGLLED